MEIIEHYKSKYNAISENSFHNIRESKLMCKGRETYTFMYNHYINT